MNAPSGSDFQQRAYVQIDLILSPLNMWYTGIWLCRPPTPNDAAWYWVLCGAAKRFQEEWDARHPKSENAY